MLSSFDLSLYLTHYSEEEEKCLNISRTLLLEHYFKDYVIFSIIWSHMLSSFVLSFYLRDVMSLYCMTGMLRRRNRKSVEKRVLCWRIKGKSS